MRIVRALATTLLCCLCASFGCAAGDSGEPGTAGDANAPADTASEGAVDETMFVLPDGGSCTKLTCEAAGANCGPVADGCGGLLDCGTCTAPELCGGGGKPSVCGNAPCTKKTCADLGAKCGMQGDGCGGLIACGTCTAPDTCGGGGTPSVCGNMTPDTGVCVAKTCASMGYDCGPTADGCGGLAMCGACSTGTCGGGGKPNVCGSSTSPCIKKTCADWGANCGAVSDGCGGLTASCGSCTKLGDTCGGGGTPSVCGGAPSPCTKKTCADFPGTCGQQSDGCGGLTASCGSCTPPQTCGGGGVPSVCGGAALCTKKTCADYPGTCGQAPDGCGGLTAASCGSCTPPATCGGGGVASKCGGGPTCTKKTCADYPAGTCGQVSDGCGGLTAICGTCVAPAICGGGGVPSKCGGGGGTTCVGLACKQVTCATGTTSISGTVFDPAGLRPLPNVFVYVPNAAVGALPSGASCDKCAASLSGSPLVTTTTDVKGQFTLKNMPVDTNVPVVLQIGKWRRQLTITTSKCADTAVPAALTHLPRNKTEGDIPKIALATGGADPLECLLRKIGLDDSEFTNPSGTGRVNLYKGALTIPSGPTLSYASGALFPDATQLWNRLDPDPAASPPIYGLRAYDVVLLGCEGNEITSNKPAGALTAMQAYTSAGGRVFGEHYHYVWLKNGPVPWPGLATWNTNSAAPWDEPANESVLTGFPKGALMSEWMKVVGAANTATPSTFPVYNTRHSIDTIKDPNVLQWVQIPTATDSTCFPLACTYSNIPQYFSFNTPLGAAPDSVCGRFVFSDIHVAGTAATDSTGVPFPTGCTSTTMSPQELALEFMFFDLASRVCDETKPPPPPTCKPLTCADQGIACGSAPDGCGGTIASCGTCTSPMVCSTGGKCAGSSCVATDCGKLGYSCGSWPDGCGGTLSCGPCTSPATCGGGGVAGKCGGASCTPKTCTALGYDCGSWPDGCGGTLPCGTCTAPKTCGGTGVPGKCGGTSCVPKTCASLGKECGSWADGCGGTLACGTCTAPATCGGGGTPGTCGGAGCMPKTCAALGVKCGPSGDGCGGTIDCGTCPTPDAGMCVPLTCGGRCGPQGDGCGGVLMCPACDGGSCIPTTCSAAGAECGDYPDGCGSLLHCGSCTSPKTCGGGGTPNRCGGIK